MVILGMKAGEKPIGTKAAALIIGRSDEWLMQQRAAKKGPPYYKLNNRYQYYESEIREWQQGLRQAS